MSLAARFFIHAEPGDPAGYIVEVHADATSMRRAIAKTGFRKRGLRALCTSFIHEIEIDGKWYRSSVLGKLFFNLQDMADDVVVHEVCAHAAIRWARRKRVNPFSDRGEERYACAVQNLFAEFKRKVAPAVEESLKHAA